MASSGAWGLHSAIVGIIVAVDVLLVLPIVVVVVVVLSSSAL
jgi:hypothetical protein